MPGRSFSPAQGGTLPLSARFRPWPSIGPCHVQRTHMQARSLSGNPFGATRCFRAGGDEIPLTASMEMLPPDVRCARDKGCAVRLGTRVACVFGGRRHAAPTGPHACNLVATCNLFDPSQIRLAPSNPPAHSASLTAMPERAGEL